MYPISYSRFKLAQTRLWQLRAKYVSNGVWSIQFGYIPTGFASPTVKSLLSNER